MVWLCASELITEESFTNLPKVSGHHFAMGSLYLRLANDCQSQLAFLSDFVHPRTLSDETFWLKMFQTEVNGGLLGDMLYINTYIKGNASCYQEASLKDCFSLLPLRTCVHLLICCHTIFIPANSIAVPTELWSLVYIRPKNLYEKL